MLLSTGKKGGQLATVTATFVLMLAMLLPWDLPLSGFSKRVVLADGIITLFLISGLRVTLPPANVRYASYKYYVFIEPEALKSGWSRDRIMTALMAEGIPCGSGSCSEIYLEKAFERNGLRPAERLPVARELGETSLMFMVHPTLSVDDMEDVVRATDKVMRVAVR